MRTFELTRPRAVALTAAAVALVGATAFLVTGSVTASQTDAGDWIAPVAAPVMSTEIDPDLPLYEALALASDGLDLADAPEPGTAVHGAQPDTAAEGEAEEPALLPLPEQLAFLEERERVTATTGETTNLTARGVTRPQTIGADSADIEDADSEGAGTGGPASSIWADEPDTAWIVGVTDPAPTADADEPASTDEGASDATDGGDPVILDVLLREAAGLVPIVVDLGPGDDGDGEPDFLDVCAAEFDDPDIACGEGTGATVLPLTETLQLLTVAIDTGTRCADHLEEGSGIPVRLSFNRPFVSGTLAWRTDVQERRTTEALIADPARAAEHEAEARPAFHHCLRLPWDGDAQVYELTVRVSDDRGQAIPRTTVTLHLPVTLTDGRPPTVLEPVTERRLLVQAPTRQDVDVTAWVVPIRPDEDVPDPGCTEAFDAIDAGNRPEVDTAFPLEPRDVVRTGLVSGHDPGYDRSAVFDLALRTPYWEQRDERGYSVDFDRRVPNFHLCLTWHLQVEDRSDILEHEAHRIVPPERPVVDVLFNPMLRSWIRLGRLGEAYGGFVWVDFSLHQHGAASDGTTRGDDHLIDRCELNGPVRPPESHPENRSWQDYLRTEERMASDEPLDPHPMCSFELLDERQEVRFHIAGFLSGPGLGAHVLRTDHVVRLPGHPSYPARCGGCVDSYLLQSAPIPLGIPSDSTRRPRGHVVEDEMPGAQMSVDIVVRGERTEGWVLQPTRMERTVERPLLDTRRTTLAVGEDDPTRGIELHYVADRPVTAQLVARPLDHVDASLTVPPGCPARQVPHVVATNELRSSGTLRIDDACARTRYRFALELTDEDGVRSLYGDPLTWLAATGELITDEHFRAGAWNPRLRTAGHQWALRSHVDVIATPADDPLPTGVFAPSLPGGASVVGSLSPAASAFASDAFLRSLEARVGPATLLHGEVTNEGRHCIDRTRRLGSGVPRYVEVGDTLTIGARAEIQHWTAGCGFNLLTGNRHWASTHLGLPSGTGTDGSGGVVLAADDLAEAGRLIIVLEQQPPIEVALPSDLHFQAVLTIEVDPDPRPTPTTLTGRSF
jgi:hypothetical protein